jgi:hypothetical protein
MLNEYTRYGAREVGVCRERMTEIQANPTIFGDLVYRARINQTAN